MSERTNGYKHIIHEGKKAFLIDKGSVFSNISRVPYDTYKTKVSVRTDEIIEEDLTVCDAEDACSNDIISDNVPSHIDSETAYFDDEGNYAGGTMQAQEACQD